MGHEEQEDVTPEAERRLRAGALERARAKLAESRALERVTSKEIDALVERGKAKQPPSGSEDPAHNPGDEAVTAAAPVGRSRGGNERTYQAMRQLVTDVRAHAEEVEKQISALDQATGFLSREPFVELLRSWTGQSNPQPFSLLLVGATLDRAGEREEHATDVVTQLSTALKLDVRGYDVIGRLDDDRFAVLMPETSAYSALQFAEQIEQSAAKASGENPPMLSFGIASFPEASEEPEQLIGAAAEALAAANSLEAPRAVIYSPEVAEMASAVKTNEPGFGVSNRETLARQHWARRQTVESQAQLATVLSLAEALDHRDPLTERHSQTVGLVSEVIANELGFDAQKVQRIRLAGILHDIGKIGVPDSILRKPGPLAPEEMEQMRRHPELGARILSSPELDDVREWVLAHHERPDGTGYPRGLTAEEIPIEAAILAVADAYEAMTTDRVYRARLSDAAVRSELEKGAGSQFDGSVVHALLRALERGTLTRHRLGSSGRNRLWRWKQH